MTLGRCRDEAHTFVMQFVVAERAYNITPAGTSCCIPLLPLETPEGQVGAFYLPPATGGPVTLGSWTGAIDAGASVNCPSINCIPHGNGTHTECIAHALPGRLTLCDIELPPSFQPALLLSVTPDAYVADTDGVYPAAGEGDRVIAARHLQAALDALTGSSRPEAASFLRGGALCIRTLPNDACAKRRAKYSGTNPPFVTQSAMAWALAHGVRHVLVDLPSVDKEDDGGHLVAHRTFWGLGTKEAPAPAHGEDGRLCSRTITELCVFGEEVADDAYLLALQVPSVGLDAAPSRPVLHAVVARE